jgi:hypothetical protein
MVANPARTLASGSVPNSTTVINPPKASVAPTESATIPAERRNTSARVTSLLFMNSTVESALSRRCELRCA